MYTNENSSLRPILTLAGLALITAFLYWARAVLVPFALAMFFAFILAPAVSYLQRHGLSRLPAVFVVVLLAYSFVGGVGYFVGNQLAGLVVRLPEYKGVISAKVESISSGQSGGWMKLLRQTMDDVARGAMGDEHMVDKASESDGAGDVIRGATPEKPVFTKPVGSDWSGFADYAGSAAEGLASAVLASVLVIFMLAQRENLRNRLVRLIGHGQVIITTRAIDEGARRVSRYLLMQLIVNACFGTVLTLALFTLSFFAPEAADGETLRRYAILWGFICGTMRFIPYIGTWAGGLMLFAFTVATVHGWALPITSFILFVVFETISANAVEPLLLGQSTGISPLALILSAAFWAWLWGPVGLLLSTPLTVVLVVIGKYVPAMHFLEVMLGDEPVLRPHVVFYQRIVAKDQDEAIDLVEAHLKDHSIEQTYEDLILPALLLARQDRARGELDAETSRELYRSIRDVIEEFAPPPAEADQEVAEPAVVLGCPASDEVDELALVMLANLLRSRARSIEIVSSKALTAEALAKVGETCPAVVVVASVAPGELAPARYLCKRIKAQCPTMKIVVCRWGKTEDLERLQQRLKQSGASVVGSTLTETRSEIVPLLQVAEASESQKKREPEEALAVSQ